MKMKKLCHDDTSFIVSAGGSVTLAAIGPIVGKGYPGFAEAAALDFGASYVK
jgi:hypothetical protein